MNTLQILACLLYLAVTFIAGSGVYAFLRQDDDMSRQGWIVSAETLLLGNMLVVGELLLLSFTPFFFGWNLWIVVLLNALFLLHSDSRRWLSRCFSSFPKWDMWSVVFVLFLAIFAFRNCFPLMDNDSHSTYLWIPKMWLMNKTSLFGGAIYDPRLYIPSWESLPYALGIVLFQSETLFASMINLLWRVLVLMLVFGYVHFRLNSLYALAAALLVLFNDHFFFSGVNYHVLINGAVAAFLFAAVYNFWESRRQGNAFRYLLGFLFLSHIPVTKLTLSYSLVGVFLVMLIFQKEFLGKVKEIFSHPRWLIVFTAGVFLAFLWFIKNMLIFQVSLIEIIKGFGFAIERSEEFKRVTVAYQGGVGLITSLKYLIFFFIWPGVLPGKIVGLSLVVLPLLMVWLGRRERLDWHILEEVAFWLGVSVVILVGLTMAGHQDPRYYRYLTPVFALSVIWTVRVFLKSGLGIRNEILIGLALLLVALTPIKTIAKSGSGFKYPSVQDNIDTFFNRLTTASITDRYYPYNNLVLKELKKRPEVMDHAAWELKDPIIYSVFLLPELPHVGLWSTTMVEWESYSDPDAVAGDLRQYGIDRILAIEPDPRDPLKVLSPEQYGYRAAQYETRPKAKFLCIDMPDELCRTGL